MDYCKDAVRKAIRGGGRDKDRCCVRWVTARVRLTAMVRYG